MNGELAPAPPRVVQGVAGGRGTALLRAEMTVALLTKRVFTAKDLYSAVVTVMERR